jgi:hypothetical protein
MFFAGRATCRFFEVAMRTLSLGMFILLSANTSRLKFFNRPKAFSSFPVKALAEAEWLLSVAAVRKDWLGSAIFFSP